MIPAPAGRSFGAGGFAEATVLHEEIVDTCDTDEVTDVEEVIEEEETGDLLTLETGEGGPRLSFTRLQR